MVTSNEFMPHGQCILWEPALLWFHVISDTLIALAYFAIPLALVYFVKSRRQIPFPGVFLMFGAFIVACGTTHLMEVWTLWTPSYWLAGGIKAVTAALSIGTALLLIPVIPQALALRTPAELEQVNRALELEIAERKGIGEERERLIEQLRGTLARVKNLEGILPICSHCKKIRDDQGRWQAVEDYVRARTDAEFSHGICRECFLKHYPTCL